MKTTEKLHTSRLILDSPATGAWNMAVDQAILESVGKLQIPTIRFYRWSPPTLSLGYFQGVESRDEHAESHSVEVVRRSSGGGAILHHHEITYSIAIPSSDRWSNRNTEVYDLAHQSIIKVFAADDIKLCSFVNSSRDQQPSNSFLCFERRARGDLILNEYKVVGSAQRRSKNALLQHGSILLKCSEFAPQLPGIFELAGKELDSVELTSRIARSFCEQFGLEAQIAQLSRDEMKLAQQISNERFGNIAWTQKQRKRPID